MCERREAYRARHGDSALLSYAGRGGCFLCEHADAQRVVLLELRTHKELELTYTEFKADFFMYRFDAAVDFFGSEHDQAVANEELCAQLAAVNLCIEQDEQAGRGEAATS